MDDRLQKLNDKAEALSKVPGVYLMKDAKGRVIYVGKSASRGATKGAMSISQI